MKPSDKRELNRRFRVQHSLVTRAQLRLLGVDRHEEAMKVSAGEWERIRPGVVRLTGSTPTPEQELLSACLAAGPAAVASHQSAAWLWGLVDKPPRRHAVTVPRRQSARLADVEIHRPEIAPIRSSTRRGIPCTNPLRTIVDVAAVLSPKELDAVIDRALASRLVTVEGIEAELGRVARQGRGGVARLRGQLQARGLVDAPHPSVLESRLLRLLRHAGIEPLGTEVRMGPDGRYRVDVLVTPTLVVEADGYAYHHSPEQKAEDERRRNRLRLTGVFVLVYTWRDIRLDGGRVVEEVRTALEPGRLAAQ